MVDQRKLDFGILKLLGLLMFVKLFGNGGCLNNLDAGITHPVTRSHLIVHLLNSTIQSGISVFLVHIVVTSSTLVAKPDTKILDCCWIFLKDL